MIAMTWHVSQTNSSNHSTSLLLHPTTSFDNFSQQIDYFHHESPPRSTLVSITDHPPRCIAVKKCITLPFRFGKNMLPSKCEKIVTVSFVVTICNWSTQLRTQKIELTTVNCPPRFCYEATDSNCQTIEPILLDLSAIRTRLRQSGQRVHAPRGPRVLRRFMPLEGRANILASGQFKWLWTRLYTHSRCASI